MAMCLNLVVTLLYLTIEIKLLMSSPCTVGALVWSAEAYMYRQIVFFFKQPCTCI